MQIKVSLDQINYEYLKNRAEKNRRTMSAELNIILDEVRERLNYLRQQPALHYPEGVRTPVPEEKYKSTVEQPPQPRRTASTIPAKKRIIGGTEEDYERALANRRGYISLNESYTI